jgi:anti-anti-sigma factor
MAELGANGVEAHVDGGVTDDGVFVLDLGGELDVSNFEAVRSQVDALLGADPRSVVVDLGSLSFMDSSGIALLVGIGNRVDDLRVRNPTPVVRRIIELCGLADALGLQPV